MFVPGDPRFEEILHLANQATATGLPDQQRQRWRELVMQLLGKLKDGEGVPERRQQLRAAAELKVHLLSPDDLAGLTTSTIGAGGVSIPMAHPPPAGTILELSISVEQRPQPLLVKAQVVWSRPGGGVGAVFIDAFVNDRELLEGIAVKAILARTALE